jgi:hypothetical protein
MAGNTEKTQNEKEVVFKCHFCGATRPLSDLVVIRHYYPNITACSACARGTPVVPAEEGQPDAAADN